MLKNIIIVYDQAFYSGGAAKIAIDSAIELSKKYNVFYFSALDNVTEELKNSKITVVTCGQKHIGLTKNFKYLLRGIWNKDVLNIFDTFLKKFNSYETIIHIHGWTKSLSSSIFKVIRKNHFKSIITLHEYFTVCKNGGLYNYRKNAICNLNSCSFKCSFTNCDKKNYFYKIYRNIRDIKQKKELRKLHPSVIYITDFSRNIIKSKLCFVPNNEYRIDNFIEENKFIYDRVSVENNDIYLFMARLSHEKGLDIFCDVINKYNLKGVVVGSGPLLESYKKIYPNIIFKGWLDGQKKYDVLKKVRALIIPTRWYETMGLTVLETMRLGIPSIVSKQSATSEFIEDGYNGLLFSIDDNDLESKLLQFKDDNFVETISLNAMKYCNAHDYSLRRHVNELINAYECELKE